MSQEGDKWKKLSKRVFSVVKSGESQNGGNEKGDNKDRPHTSASDSPTHKCCFVHLNLDTRPNLQGTYVLWFQSRIAVLLQCHSLEIQDLNNSTQHLAVPQRDSSLQINGYLVEYFVTSSFPFTTVSRVWQDSIGCSFRHKPLHLSTLEKSEHSPSVGKAWLHNVRRDSPSWLRQVTRGRLHSLVSVHYQTNRDSL